MATRRRQPQGSSVVASNFGRLASTFPGSPQSAGTGTSTATLERDGTATSASDGPVGTGGPASTGTVYPGYPGYSAPTYPPPPTMTGGASTGFGDGRPFVTDTAPFVASEVYNKVGILSALAVAAGAVTYLFHISAGLVIGLVFAAFVVAIITSFRPRSARTLAPVYALLEGLALGGLSRFFETGSQGIVPLAILFTAVVFGGTLGAYRLGLVRVGRRFIVGTTVATFGLFAVLLAAFLGAPVPGANGVGIWSVVIGVVYLFVAVMNLFVDFEYVKRAEASGVSAEGEWYAAFTIMLALVMVYIAMLRILAGRR
ncbi:MAG: Bax inhibitor-1/YccA family protein [Acidimicrobiales bacterium]